MLIFATAEKCLKYIYNNTDLEEEGMMWVINKN